MITYGQVEEYILSIPKFTTKNTVEDTRDFYQYLGEPGKHAEIFHVAGTNGKGSVCSYINSVLLKEGIPVGMFTSPHLVSMRERIQFQGEWIQESDFIECFETLREKIQEYKRQEEKKNYHPTFFEHLFFMAMLYFENQQSSVIILETGMGGRLDATNMVFARKICVITEIGFDHMEYLGETLEEIAREKAGIIQPGNKVIYSHKRQETSDVIRQKAKEVGGLCKSVTKPVDRKISFVDKTIDFSFTSRYYGYVPIRIRTVAQYQAENAMLALNAIEAMEQQISQKAMQEGMEACLWPARMEEILPKVYLDGAHNEDGIEAFLQTVSLDRCEGHRWVLFSAVADKEFRKMKDMVMGSKLFHHTYVCCIKNARGLKKKELEAIFSGEKVKMIEEAEESLQEIVSLKKEQDKVYIVGSLYLAGEIKESLARKNTPVNQRRKS